MKSNKSNNYNITKDNEHERRDEARRLALREMTSVNVPASFMEERKLKNCNIPHTDKLNSPFFKAYELTAVINGCMPLPRCFKCLEKSSNEEFAVKIIRNKRFKRAEVDILRMCQSYNFVVKLKECITDNLFTYIIMELLSEELYSRIKTRKGNGLPKDEVSLYFSQILNAVHHLHSNNIVHCDLKPQNMLFESRDSNVLKLIDFGFAKSHNNEAEWKDTPRYTLQYAAPELLLEGKTVIFSKACDIWALGVILYLMISGHLPFKYNNNDSPLNTKMNILQRNINQKPAGWKNASEDLKDLIHKMLNPLYRRRATIKDVFNHIWVKNSLQKTSLTQKQQKLSINIKQKIDEDEEFFGFEKSQLLQNICLDMHNKQIIDEDEEFFGFEKSQQLPNICLDMHNKQKTDIDDMHNKQIIEEDEEFFGFEKSQQLPNICLNMHNKQIIDEDDEFFGFEKSQHLPNVCLEMKKMYDKIFIENPLKKQSDERNHINYNKQN